MDRTNQSVENVSHVPCAIQAAVIKVGYVTVLEVGPNIGLRPAISCKPSLSAYCSRATLRPLCRLFVHNKWRLPGSSNCYWFFRTE